MIPPFMPMTTTAARSMHAEGAEEPLRSTKAFAVAGATITSTTPSHGSCTASVPQNAAWIAAAEKASQWATSICAKYPADICAAYGSYLNDCGGGDIVLRWYNGGVPIDVDVPRWLCDQGYASPLYPKFYPISGVCPPRGPRPDGAVPMIIDGVMVQWNDHAPKFWKVSPLQCEPGQRCSFQFFYPCEPLIPGKEPKIVEWLWKAVPGRIRPSSIAPGNPGP